MGFGPSSSKSRDSGDIANVAPPVSDLHCFTETAGIITTTMTDLPGYRITKVLGAVYGVTVRSRNIAAGIAMALKSIAGGELSWFTSMLYSCRNDSINRVVDEARQRGGNAIICLRFDAGELGGYAQTCAYGTACVVEKIEDENVDAPQLHEKPEAIGQDELRVELGENQKSFFIVNSSPHLAYLAGLLCFPSVASSQLSLVSTTCPRRLAGSLDNRYVSPKLHDQTPTPAVAMAFTTPEAEPRASHDSISSASTTSLVFERLHEKTEKDAQKDRGRKEGYNPGLEDEDPLKDDDAEDLETGPFLGPGASLHRKPMDKGLRRILIIIGSVFIGGWLVGLAVFIASGSYKHDSESEHDPDALSRGSGKAVTMDQIFKSYWQPKSHSISWIAGPDGEDGLMIEIGASGKDYMVVENVQLGKDNAAAGDAATEISKSRTLIKEGFFEYGDRYYTPQWTGTSPDLKKVLIGVDRKKAWRHSFTATYFILDVETQEVEPLLPLSPLSRVQLATWSPQSDAVAFTQDNNLFIRHLGGKDDVTQITRDGGPEYFYGIPDWVYEEEVFAGNSATWWSDDGKYLAFLRTNETGVPEYPVQFFISRPSGTEPAEGDEAYPEVQQIKYPKAGAHNPVVDLQFYDIEQEDVFSVPIDGAFDNDNRIINNLVWAGKKVIVKETNRVSDVLKVVLIDVASREGKTINTIDVDKIDGGWFEISHKTTYIPADPDNGRPEDGYVDAVIHEDHDHIAYFTPLDNPDPIMLTSGAWEVEDAPSAVDLANNLVYFIATKESSIQRHVYSVSLDGSDLRPLTNTSAEAYYGASFSAGAGFVLLSYRGPKIPFQQVVSTPSTHAVYSHTLEDNAELADRARKHELPVLKYGTVDIGDDIKLNYLERRPPHFDPKKQYPVLFQQYSGPGSQSVTKKFAVDFQAYVAAALGYLVITVDPRGTGFLGRAHRVAVRSQLGVLEAHDHIAAARVFAARPYVDASRLAIWGWSYGGFTTLKTLEQDAGATFSYGMAVAPVTDWRFYDSIYTERYMRTPQDNTDGYDAAKVANATALGQNKRFLVMHGVADDNVHFQNSLTLLDDLDLAGVENYDVHVFPDSDHSIYFHNGNRIVYDKLRNWLINAFNGEWLKVSNPKPIGKADKKRSLEASSN
ncbi:hypothetical protein G7046_g56 [Stylonectria norvegica]|nr:hypothetical protein G7046_g56 [Stylonectria norvegica]